MIKKVGNKYIVYGKDGRIIVMTSSRRIAERLDGS